MLSSCLVEASASAGDMWERGGCYVCDIVPHEMRNEEGTYYSRKDSPSVGKLPDRLFAYWARKSHILAQGSGSVSGSRMS